MNAAAHAPPAPGTQPCVGLEIPPGPGGVDVLMPALRAALGGAGPAVALLPGGGSQQSRALVAEAVSPAAAVPDGVAVVLATSGSTGRPAGVLLPGSALRAAAHGFERLTDRPGGHRWVAALPLAHAGGLMVAVRCAVAGTHPVAVSSLGGAGRFSLAAFEAGTLAARDLSARDRRPMAVSLVPPMLALLAAEPDGLDLLRAYDVVLVGGAAAPAQLVARLRSADVLVRTSYGMTETCGGVAFDGFPLPGVEITADADGRLTVAGAQVALGYRDGREPERWSPTEGGTRRFRTDDLGAVDRDGRVRIDGRSDDVVQVAGSNVSLSAVRAVLSAQVGVAAAEVVALPEQTWGARIVAVLVPVASAAAEPRALATSAADAVHQALGRAARPRQTLMVDELPLLAAGKIDRQALREWARQHEQGGSS